MTPHLLLALLCLAPAAAAPADAAPADAAPADGGTGVVSMPEGDVFDPLLADAKNPESLASAVWLRSRSRSTVVGAVAYGENVGLLRWRTGRGRDGVQLGIAGAVFAQFDLDAPSAALLNADYTVGVQLTQRRRRWSGRLRVYHLSSHLGDEYLIAQKRERVDLRYEAVELMGAVQRGGARVYAGGELLVRRNPASLSMAIWHAGVDYRHPRRIAIAGGGEGQLVAGIDARESLSDAWFADLGVRAGIELGPRAPDEAWRRRTAVLLEYHEGHSPYGQFFSEKVTFLGLGVHFVR